MSYWICNHFGVGLFLHLLITFRQDDRPTIKQHFVLPSKFIECAYNRFRLRKHVMVKYIFSSYLLSNLNLRIMVPTCFYLFITLKSVHETNNKSCKMLSLYRHTAIQQLYLMRLCSKLSICIYAIQGILYTYSSYEKISKQIRSFPHGKQFSYDMCKILTCLEH